MTGVHHNPRVALPRRTAVAMQNRLHAALEDSNRERGAEMVEYGLMLVFVLLAAFFTVKVFGESIVALFDAGANTLENAPNVETEG